MTARMTAHPREGTWDAGPTDLPPRLLSGGRLESWLPHSALPTPGTSARAKCLCFPILVPLPHIVLYPMRQPFPIGKPKSLPHPPARLPCRTISALTCTSDTAVPRLISPKSVSSAVIASARHLQAPDSLPPKGFLKDIEFLTRVSSGCLEKDVAQNYSKIAFTYFLCNY